MQILKRSVLVSLALFLTACASIDFDYPRDESHAIASTGETTLAMQLHDTLAAAAPDESGFYLLRDGMDSLAMRLQLMQRAESSIDIQVYQFHADIVGGLWIHHLLQAADRGVRVRLLLDDTTTEDYDAGLVGLASHPNFEIRSFNPFHRGFAGQTWSVLTGLGRINRRMHNKTFIVDNQVTVIGGRNVADEYYYASSEARFSDLDVFAIGPVVADASTMFDTYWNHQTALPLPAFAEMPADPAAELERVRRKYSAAREALLDTEFAQAIWRKEIDFIDFNNEALTWSQFELVYDSPDKGVVSRKDTAETIRTPLVEVLESAQRELLIVTPYFVPRKSGIQRFTQLQDEGVQISVVTNSLASQDQLLVHGGYSAARKKLLRQGVKLYEFSPDETLKIRAMPTGDDKMVTLHTKAFIVDRELIFVGSFNFDPRSAYLNTESGLILYSPGLAEQYAAVVLNALADRTYELFLTENEKLRWLYRGGNEEIVLDKEPQTTRGRRTKAKLARLLPIRGHL